MRAAMKALLGGKSKSSDSEDGVWQDRDIRFDTALSQLAIRPGEFQIDSINSVEDTKGNNGERGSLAITNLRLIWICARNSRINLSIGYNAVLSINIRTANSRLRGNTQALFVMTKYNNARFEFVFTNLVRQSPRLFTTVQAVYRAYDTSRLFRDLKVWDRSCGTEPRPACPAVPLPDVEHHSPPAYLSLSLSLSLLAAARRDHQEQVAHPAAQRAAVQQDLGRVEPLVRPGGPEPSLSP